MATKRAVKKAIKAAEKKAAEVKATEEKAAEIKTETVKEVKPVEKIETTKDTTKAIETKAAVLVEETPVEKPVAKKTTVRKAAAKKTVAKKAEVKTEMFLQFAGKEYTEKEIFQKVKDVWTKTLKNKVGDMKTVQIYLKPEESAAYYVINGDTTGKIDL